MCFFVSICAARPYSASRPLCLLQSTGEGGVRPLNDFDILTYYNVAFEFTIDELMAKRSNSYGSSRRNMSYYAASQAVRVVGKGNQVTWHPGIKGFLTGVHEDTRDEDGNEIPENMPAAVRV